MRNSPACHLTVHRPPFLNVEEALNWGNMVDDEAFQSWEVRANLAFEVVIVGNNNNDEYIQLLQDVILADQKKKEDNVTANATLHNPLEMREVNADPTETQ
ncbi:hypothetical protein LguiA_010721 [Lonicera macranthoides]